MSDDVFFGTDGIRDRYGSGRLSPENLPRIGRALAAFVRERVGPTARVFFGRDTRPSGPALLDGLAAGLAAGGLPCEDGGVLPTPAIACWTASGGCDVGVALTASHHPAEDNGVKVFLPGGRKTTPEDEAALDALIRAAAPTGRRASPVARPDALEAYVAAALAFLSPGGRLDGLTLVVDCANGATTRTARRVLEALGARILTPVGSDAAGAINDRCGTEHRDAWLAAVVEASADGGLAFDGDGDRVLLADAKGEVLDGDPLLHLLARDFHERGRLVGDRVVATVMSNFGLEQALGAVGVTLERAPVGDRHVAARMRETGATLGGEQSGHVVLEWGGALIGDGLVAGVTALEAARRRGLSLEAARCEVVKVPQVLRNVRVARKVPLADSPEFTAAVSAEERRLRGKGRVVVRYSGTEPVLRIMVEATDADAVAGAVARLESAAAASLR
jgi:phosphoglucosamine mutase